MSKVFFLLFFSLFYSYISAYTQNVSSSVPIPWTPLQVKQNNQITTVECWGRKYIFNHTPFPSQIYSQNVPLLSKPINAIISLGGEIMRLDTASIKISLKTDTTVELETKSKLKNSIEVITKIHIEYDGLMLISLNTNSSANFRSASYAIQIPYNDSVSKYYIKGGENANYSGGLSSNNGLLLNSSFTPYFWIGDNNRGLFWFCESPQNWPNAQEPNAIQITRQGNEIIQKFDLGTTGFYQFGIQATPVKPFPNNWRSLRLAPAINYNIVILLPKLGGSSQVKYFGWPEPVNDSGYMNLIKDNHKNNKMVLPYAIVTMLRSSLPLHQNNKLNWKEGEKAVVYNNMDSMRFIEPNSKNYKQTVSQQLSYFLKKYSLDGYYLDATKLYPYLSNNQKYYPILGYRELQKNLYNSIKSKNPNALIVAHMSRYMDIPVLSFADAYVDGEQFRAKGSGDKRFKVKESYLDVIDLDQFRAEFIGKQWGIIPFFLPELDPATRDSVQPTLGLASLLVVHDVQPWPIWSNISVWNKMYKALDSFQFKNSTFIPYYDPKPPALINNLKDVYVSAYKKENEALIVVANLSKNFAKGKITLNNNVLGIKKITSFYSFFDSTKMDFNQNTISLNLDPLSYQLFWVK